MDILATVAEELGIRRTQAEAAAMLLDEGNTVPFIARYRKEATGSLDDQVLRALADRLTYLRGFEARKQEICDKITEQGNMTEAVQSMLARARTMAELEDVYRPFRPKRKTRASVAREQGLAPLADRLLAQEPSSPPPLVLAQEYADPEKGVESAEAALQGAKDIIAEYVSDAPQPRGLLRALAYEEGVIETRAARDEDSVYRTYYDYSEPVSKIAGHRVLAINRGEAEGYLKVSLALDEGKALHILYSAFVRPGSACTPVVEDAAKDAYARLIFPALERELRGGLTEKAAEGAMKVFSVNLRSLLMQPPVRGRVVLGLDPAYRTGCKLAVVDDTGAVLATDVIYPTPPQNRVAEAEAVIKNLIRKYGVSVISIGNGTASKESEIFIANLIRESGLGVQYMVVNEAGASVYSASRLAAEEFPQFDVSLRSAISIARRLQDPLAELVKIDPKAIGVGQYQHDLPQNRLAETLGNVVDDCVNSVGVDLNTASAPLLAHVSGINAGVAKSIVEYRGKEGAFRSRRALLKVPKLGKKAYEQAAGFLRVPESDNVLDNTFVHPESYDAAKGLLSLCGYDAAGLSPSGFRDLAARAEQYGLKRAADSLGVGLPTLRDIIAELTRPGRDPREDLPAPMLRSDVMDINDLRPGMELKGTVRNCVDFGAFVDVGVHQDGLVHISQISNRFIRHPSEVLKVGDIVTVRVLECDPVKKRISLTMKN